MSHIPMGLHGLLTGIALPFYLYRNVTILKLQAVVSPTEVLMVTRYSLKFKTLPNTQKTQLKTQCTQYILPTLTCLFLLVVFQCRLKVILKQLGIVHSSTRQVHFTHIAMY